MLSVLDIAAALALGIAICVLTWQAFSGRRRAASRMRQALADAQLNRTDAPRQAHSTSGLLSALVRWGRALRKLPGAKQVVRALAGRPSVALPTERALASAALLRTFSVEDVVGAQLGAGILCFLALSPPLLAGNKDMLLLACLLFAIGYVYPQVVVKRLAQERQAEIERALSRATDILVIATEAGLPLGRAIDLYCERFRGPLADEWAEAQRRMRLGERQRDVIVEMVERIGVDDLRVLMMAILQAQRFGVEIAEVLREQSEGLKLRREQRIRSESLKAPTKMLFPLVFCLLPAVFIVVMGPVVIQLMSSSGPLR